MKIVLTKSEQKAFDIMLEKSDLITTRDEIAQSVWGNSWTQKYSDWQIDRLIYLLRKKLPKNFKIKTLRNSGYILTKSEINISKLTSPRVVGTLPTTSYLEYMNNPKNQRKVLSDLFKAIKISKKINHLLVVNSYSFDNVDAVYKNLKVNNVYFSNFDNRALKFHQEEIEKLDLDNYSTVYDDIRNSIFKNNLFDLIINDFRLNFNTSDKQNILAMKNIYRILKNGGLALISVVIDTRKKTNRITPWRFKAQENLERLCFTPEYYYSLFKTVGFKKIKEFDIDNGKKWNPQYKRYLLTK